MQKIRIKNKDKRIEASKTPYEGSIYVKIRNI